MSEHNAAVRFDQLDDKVKEMLRKLEADEVDNLKYMATIPKTEFQGIMRFIRDIRAAGWYVKWGVASIIAIFLTSVAVGEQVMKVVAWFKGAPPA